MTFKDDESLYPGRMVWGIFLCLVFFSETLSSQKRLVKSWDTTAIVRLEVNANEAYLINLETQPNKDIYVEAYMEGEHSEQIVLNSEITNGALRLSPDYQKFFKDPNDKLSIHKVTSIALNIIVPEHFYVSIRSRKGRLKGTGYYKMLEVAMDHGSCTLQKFRGNAVLNTVEGPIQVFAQPGVSGWAKSEAGIVYNELPTTGSFTLKAESVKGAISLRKSRE